MPFTTQLPNGVITLDTNGLPVISTNFVSILNALGPSVEFTDYDVPGDQGTTTLQNGDNFALRNVDSGTGDISTVDSGTYLGDFTLSTASATASILGNSVSVTLNPIEGDVYQDENGDFFMLTDQPLTEDRLGLTVELDPLFGPTLSVNLNLSDPLSGIPLVGNLAAPLVQQVLDTTLVTFDVDVNGTLTFDDALIPCFARGTNILTKTGSVPVELLQVGDWVFTRDNGFKQIRWIGSATVSESTLLANENIRPVRIQAGALGTGVPCDDLMVSPQHRVLMKSEITARMFGALEILVAAKKLLDVDGVTRDDSCEAVEYFHILFDQHEIIYSNLAPTESLFTGKQALLAVGAEARQEILILFPELRKKDYFPTPARLIPEGKKLKTLISRHAKNNKRVLSRDRGLSVL
jgi:hypothetical protein